MTKHPDKIKSQGFHFFMLEFIEDGDLTKKYPSFEALRSLANSAWNNLPKEKREKYRKEAEKFGIDKIEKEIGKVADEYKLVERGQRQKEILADEKIQDFLLQSFRDWNCGWNSQIFIIGHVNYIAKIKNDFFVNEVGLLKFSIEDGIIDTLHFHFNSGILPIGHEREARERSDDTHQLPINNLNFGIKSKEARDKINVFLDNEKYRYIFTLNEGIDVNATKFLFDKIMDDEFYVTPLENLLTGLFKIIKDSPLAKKDAQYMLINSNPWENYDIGCDYHAEKANSKFCSLAKVNRWAYHIYKILLPRELLYPGTHSPIL